MTKKKENQINFKRGKNKNITLLSKDDFFKKNLTDHHTVT